jgi:hypothetical protein
MQKGKLLVMANKKINKLLRRRFVTVRSLFYRVRVVRGTVLMSMEKKKKRDEEAKKKRRKQGRRKVKAL